MNFEKELTTKQMQVLIRRARNPRPTQEQIAKDLKISARAVRYRIEAIRKKGINPTWL